MAENHLAKLHTTQADLSTFVESARYFNSNHNNIVAIETQTYPLNVDGKKQLERKAAAFYKINTLSFDDEYPRREAFENVLFAIDKPTINFVYILEGSPEGINLYMGVVKNSDADDKLKPSDYSKNLKLAFEGNFNGSKLEPVNGEDFNRLLNVSADEYRRAGFIVGVPSINEDSHSSNNGDFQGIDRLINSMLGNKWRVVIVCQPVSEEEIYEYQENVYNIYNRLSVFSKMSLQQQRNQSVGASVSKSSSDSTNHSYSTNKGSSVTKGKSDSKGTQSSSSNSSSSTNESGTTSQGSSTSDSHGISNSNSISSNSNTGSSTSLSIEIINKRVQETMSYIDEELLKRQKIGLSKGLYKTSLMFMAENNQSQTCLQNTLMSLFQGDGSSFSPLKVIPIPEDMLRNSNLLSIYQNFEDKVGIIDPDIPALYCRPYRDKYLGLSTYMTASEISLIAGLPQIEVPGIVLKKAVNFGLNEQGINQENSIVLGKIVQRGRVLGKAPFMLDKNSLSKHTFIAGVTGSGKTTTCHRLLNEFRKPYLVIEPAKTEYRTLIQQDKDLIVFTVGNESLAPFRLNPFELIPGEIISSHIDMVKATFTSAFPMEGSMPQLLEEAIIKIYEEKGWNLATNQNTIYGERAFDRDLDSFPRLSELLSALKDVVEEKDFGNRLGSEYLGSLVSRLSNLTKGTKGYMLDCYHSVDFDFIVSNNVVLELEELKSPEDKALIMGFVISRISSVIKQKHKKDKNFTHLTLIEEAHRLLSKPDFSDSGSKKAAVETFSDLLAEVRKYGEGLIIVDQIPNKLAPEVLKNTNTKIIHKILARDDKEAVGDTMLMDDKQKEFLSALPTGQAIIFTENTDNPVNVQIDRISDTNEAEIDDSVVESRFAEKKQLFGYGAYFKQEIMALEKDCRTVIEKLSMIDNCEESLNALCESIRTISSQYKSDEKDEWYELLTYILRRVRPNSFSGKSHSEVKEALVSFFMSAPQIDMEYLISKLHTDLTVISNN